MPKNNSKENRERRHREATERQAIRESLTAREKYDLLFSRPGMALRERARLRLAAFGDVA